MKAKRQAQPLCLTINMLVFSLVVCSCNQPAGADQGSSVDTAERTDTVNPVQSESTAARDTQRVLGIDISHHQTIHNWDSVKDARVDFVFVKATGGQDFLDPRFYEHWAALKREGIRRGAYHFYYTQDKPEAEADFFINSVLKVSDDGDLPPVLDLETHGVNTDITIEEYQANIMTWLQLVEKAFNRRPIIYTSPNFAQKFLDKADFGKYHLWLVKYEVDEPLVPDPCSETGWRFWQFTSEARIKGIKEPVDHTWFSDSFSKLLAL